MIGWQAQRSLWPLGVIAALGSVLSLQGCSGKVQDTPGCGTGSSCGGAVGATGGSGQGGSAASGAGDHQGGASVAPDACENGLKDRDEADVDCGGASKCVRCTNNARCSRNTDCESAFCQHNRCADPSCTDKVLNQNETGVDCGGSCKPCDIGMPCLVNADCSGAYCANQVCIDHCSDQIKDADETDVDCGGPTCSACADAGRCVVNADCASSVCSNAICKLATCTDQIMNQDETDVDCGGVCGERNGCSTGERCLTNADCESYICSATTGKCLADIVIAAADMTDDFEDGDLFLPSPARSGRVGTWYLFDDASGGSDRMVIAAVNRGSKSVKGLHATGGGFTGWGSGVGVDLNNSGSDSTTKVAYDASAYSAITFWARALTATNIVLLLPDADTVKGGGVCTTCDHHYYQEVSLKTNWQRYTVSFSDLSLEPGAAPVPTAFKPNSLFSVIFRFASGADYDVYVDDVAFIKK